MRARGTQQSPPTSETKFSSASPHAIDTPVVVHTNATRKRFCEGRDEGGGMENPGARLTLTLALTQPHANPLCATSC